MIGCTFLPRLSCTAHNFCFSEDSEGLTYYFSFYLKEITTFILQEYIKIKLIKFVLIMVSTKILSSTTFCNIGNNNNMFLEHQISILELFLKDCETEDWSNDAENSALHHRNTFNLRSYLNRKQKFLNFK